MSERGVEFRVIMGKYMCTGIIRLRGGLSARLLDDSAYELPDLSSRARYDPSPEDVAPPPGRTVNPQIQPRLPGLNLPEIWW